MIPPGDFPGSSFSNAGRIAGLHGSALSIPASSDSQVMAWSKRLRGISSNIPDTVCA